MTTKRDHNPSQSIADVYAFGRLFSIETARDVAEEVGLPPLLDADEHDPEIEASAEDMVFAQLAKRLNDAAARWVWDERQQTSATAGMTADLAARVAAKCAGLMAIVTGADGEMLDSLGSGGLWAHAARDGGESGRAKVDDAVRGVGDLHRWALALAEMEGRRSKLKGDADGPSRRPDEAFNKLLGTLGSIYVLFWRRPPGFSRDAMNGNRVTGPFFRFASAVLYEMEDARDDAALASAIRRNPTLEGLRAMFK